MKLRFVHLPVVDSTNAEAIRRCRNGCGSGTVIVAERQTAGRGSYGKKWASPPGGLWMSLVVPPVFTGSETRYFTDAAVAAARDTVSPLLPDREVAIKPPNDLLVNGKKICGVLAEHAAGGNENFILGIGLNVNLRLEDLPRELRGTATSLLLETGKHTDISDLCSVLAGAVAARLTAAAADS